MNFKVVGLILFCMLLCGMVFASDANDSNSSTPVSLSVSASVVSTNLDKAGTQNVFGPGPDFFGNVGNDFEWAVTLNLLSEKTIKSIIIKHIYPGSKYEEQAWSTSSERVFGLDLYPIVVFLNGTQVNNKYDEQIGPLPIGSTTLDLYGQIERSSFHGGTIDFVFTDGTTVSATIPASDLTVTPISMTGLSCSGATKADLNKFLNQTVVSSSGDGLTYSQTDYCLNDHLLAKGLCGGLNGLNKQFVNSYQPCANGCVEGKCLFEAGSSVSSNGGGSSAIAVPITTQTTAVSEPVPTPTTASVVNPSTNQSVLVQSSPGVNVCMDGDTRDYDCADGKKVTWCSCIGAEWRCITAPEAVCSGAGSLACTGCENKLDKTCVSTGTRIISDLGATINPAVDRTIVETPLFCDLDKSFKEQKADGAVCQNNYECTSNTCSSGKCVNIQEQLTKQNDILQQIVDWLSKFFGLKFN